MIIIHTLITANLRKFRWSNIRKQAQICLAKEDGNLVGCQTSFHRRQLLLKQLKAHLWGAHDLLPRKPEHLSPWQQHIRSFIHSFITNSLTHKCHRKLDQDPSIMAQNVVLLRKLVNSQLCTLLIAYGFTSTWPTLHKEKVVFTYYYVQFHSQPFMSLRRFEFSP